MSLNESYVEDDRQEILFGRDRQPLEEITNTIKGTQNMVVRKIKTSTSDEKTQIGNMKAEKMDFYQQGHDDVGRRAAMFNDIKSKATPCASKMNSPRSITPSIASTNIPHKHPNYDERNSLPKRELRAPTSCLQTVQPGSAYTKAMSDLQKMISEKEREYIMLKQEYDQLREEFSDPLQCDQVIDHFTLELRELTKQAHEITASNQALVIKREEIEYGIQQMRVKSFKLDSEIEKHSQIMEKSQHLLLKKEKEVAQITGTSFVGNFSGQDFHQKPFKAAQVYQRPQSYEVEGSKEVQYMDQLRNHDDRSAFNLVCQDSKKSYSDYHALMGQDRGPIKSERYQLHLQPDPFPAFSDSNLYKAGVPNLDYMPKQLSSKFAEAMLPKNPPEGNRVLPVAQKEKRTEQTFLHSEEGYQEMYRLMVQKQSLRSDITEMARRGDTESEFYRMLSKSATELDEMIQVLREILKGSASEAHLTK